MDKYDEAIEWLVEHPDELWPMWSGPSGGDAGCLFEFCSAEPDMSVVPNGEMCGCLVMIRESDTYSAWTPELTDEIRADDRLPRSFTDLKGLRGDALRAALQPFAEWQRRLDKEIRGVGV